MCNLYLFIDVFCRDFDNEVVFKSLVVMKDGFMDYILYVEIDMYYVVVLVFWI